MARRIDTAAVIESIRLKESAAAATPAAGYFSIYAKTDGKLYTKNDAGTEVEVGAGTMTNPMTTQGDLIVGGASGTPGRLAKGTASQVLTMNSEATAPEWKDASGGGGTVPPAVKVYMNTNFR